MCSIPGGSGKWLGRWCAGSLSLWRRSWRQRRAWRRLWWAGSIGGSSHHPRLLGLSSPGVCRPRGAALRPCAARGHVDLTRFLLLLPVFCCLFHRVRRTAAQSGAECPTAQAEGAEVGSLGVVTMATQKPALELTSTASFARVVVLMVLLCVLFQVRRQRSQ